MIAAADRAGAPVRTIVRALLLLVASVVMMSTRPSPGVAAPPVPDAAGHRFGHDVRVELDPAAGTLVAVDRITAPSEAAPSFSLAPWLTVTAVEVDGRPARFTAVDGVIEITGEDWDAEEPPRQVTLTYEATLEARGHAGAPAGAVIGPEGSFLPAGTGWLPRGTVAGRGYRLTVSVPRGQVAVATGHLVEERETGDGYSATFVWDRGTDPPSLFAGPLTVRERRHGRNGGVRLRTYLHPEVAHLAEDYLDAAGAFIDRFANRIGAYPFPGFAIVSSPLPVGLGFPGLTLVSRRILPLPFMRGRSLAHEVLHNWWGNGIHVDYSAGNWAEGLTTYMADYALAEDLGPEAARQMRYDWLRTFHALPPERRRPLTSFVARAHGASQAVGYDKAAFVFHMLRREIGEDAFYGGLRVFWRENRFTTASWAQLEAAFEKTAGRPLDWFFRQWLQRDGAPRLAVDRTAPKAPEPGASAASGQDGAARQDVLSFAIRQGEPAYRLSVPVTVTMAGSTFTEGVPLSGTETEAQIELPSAPLALAVDPDFHLFRELTEEEAPPIFRDVTFHPDTRLRLATDLPDARRSALALARRMLEREPDVVQTDAVGVGARPLLIIATPPDLDEIGASAGTDIAPPPGEIAGRGTARAWAGRRDDGTPFVVVVANDAADLQAVIRPLPHYLGVGYLAFDGGNVLVAGTGPVRSGSLSLQVSDRPAAETATAP